MRFSKDKAAIKTEEGLNDLLHEKVKGGGKRAHLLVMIFLTFSYFLVEIFVGYFTGSVALVADSFHMLSDVISLVIAYVAVKMSPKKWSQNTFGWARAEVLGALINAVFLAALCFSILVEALERFIEKPDIKEPKLILIVGTIGLVINIIGLFLFHDHGHSHGGSHGHSHNGSKEDASHFNHNQQKDNDTTIINETNNRTIHLVGWSVHEDVDGANGEDIHKEAPSKRETEQTTESIGSSPTNAKKASSSGSQMNLRGVYLHVLADAFGSIVVIISALIIWLSDWEYKNYVDPFLSIIMVLLILASVWPLLQESAMVLLQTVPTHIQIDELKKKLLSQIQGTLEVHEFHIWQLAGNRIICSAHVLCGNRGDYNRIAEEVKEFFHNEGIHSTTIQLEFESENSSNNSDENNIESFDCFLTCPGDKNPDCDTNSCCGVKKRKLPIPLGSTNIAFITENSQISAVSKNIT